MDDWRGLFITIPTAVVMDDALTDGSKLLYGYIASLAQLDGYCYATNAYLAQITNMGDRTIRNHIKTLKDAGYIDVIVIRDEKGEVKERQIHCMTNFKGEKMEIAGTDKPEKRRAYGSQKNILLTDKQYGDLKVLYPAIDEEIESMSLYCSANGKGYKNYYSALLNWMRRRQKDEKPKGGRWDGVDY